MRNKQRVARCRPAARAEAGHTITDPTTLRILELHRALVTIELELFNVKKGSDYIHCPWTDELEAWQEAILLAQDKAEALVGRLVLDAQFHKLQGKYLLNGKLPDWKGR